MKRKTAPRGLSGPTLPRALTRLTSWITNKAHCLMLFRRNAQKDYVLCQRHRMDNPFRKNRHHDVHQNEIFSILSHFFFAVKEASTSRTASLLPLDSRVAIDRYYKKGTSRSCALTTDALFAPRALSVSFIRRDETEGGGKDRVFEEK